jgi:hypothetical protein
MNTIYYANLKNGKRAAVRISQPSYATICKIDNGEKSIARNKTKPLPTMAQADAEMQRKGFVRWSRRKEIPGFQEIKIRRAA